MTTVFQGNLATCPKCQNTFSHDKVNGLAVIEAVNDIDSRKRMYIRLTLDRLESLAADPTKPLTFDMIKKIILDNFNDYNRDVQTILGWGADE